MSKWITEAEELASLPKLLDDILNNRGKYNKSFDKLIDSLLSLTIEDAIEWSAQTDYDENTYLNCHLEQAFITKHFHNHNNQYFIGPIECISPNTYEKCRLLENLIIKSMALKEENKSYKTIVNFLITYTKRDAIIWIKHPSKDIKRYSMKDAYIHIYDDKKQDIAYMYFGKKRILKTSLCRRLIEAIEKNMACVQDGMNIGKSQNAEKRTTFQKPTPDNISPTSVLVRSSIFKCIHNEHHVENIDANVTIIPRSSKASYYIQKSVPVGFCKECNVFYMLDSTYVSIKKIGIPICKVTEEKDYRKTTAMHGIELAEESILMQYGYNVSQQEDLQEATRQKILATLVDYSILSKAGIISYLDFFINQRSGQSRYEHAISKWELDREFISNYKVGTYRKMYVNSIVS